MAKIQLKRSVILDGTSAKEPTSSQMNYGEIAINYNKDDPSIFIKDSDDAIIRIAGVNAKGNTPSDIQGYPDILDGKGATLDNRYLKLGSGIGAQVVQSSSATDFNGGLKVSGGSTYLLELADSGATKFVVLPTGQVGIGVTTPTAPLQVNGQVVAGSFAGTGTAITTLDAGNISQGTINTARLPATYTLAQQIAIEATGSLGNLVLYADQNIGLTAFNTGSYISLTANNGQGSYRLNKAGQTAIAGLLDFESLTSDRTFTYPDESGTIALTTGLATKLPLAGGTMTGNINMNGSDLIAAGKVGIGTGNPERVLDVRSDVNRVATFRSTTPNAIIEIYDDTTTKGIAVGRTGDDLALLTNDEIRLSITATGNVGIGGITTPTHLLHIGGDTNSLGSTAGNELSNLRIHSRTANSDLLDFTARRVSAGTDWTTAAQRIQRKIDATLMGYIQLGNYNSDLITFGRNNNEYARLDGTGKFGIGTTNPQEKLDVSGNGKFSGTVSAQGSILTSDQRFKENITDANSQLADVTTLGNQLRNWDWSSDAPVEDKDTRFLGLIAQEVETFCPGLVTTITRTKQGAGLTPETVVPAVYETRTVPAVLNGEGEVIEPETTEELLVTEEKVVPATYEEVDDSYKAIKNDVLTMKLLGAVAELSAEIDALKKISAT